MIYIILYIIYIYIYIYIHIYTIYKIEYIIGTSGTTRSKASQLVRYLNGLVFVYSVFLAALHHERAYKNRYLYIYIYIYIYMIYYKLLIVS